MCMGNILVVDDESGIRELICDALDFDGHQVSAAVDGFEALKKLREHSFDLVIADINMPRVNGYEMLKQLRDMGNETPILLLTARDETSDIVQGFETGADDYVTKPFVLDELLMRVKAILKRSNASKPGDNIIQAGPLELNLTTHQTFLKQRPVDLSPTEFKLLKYLVEHKNTAIRKETLLDAIWGMGFATNATVVDTYVFYLRRKLHSKEWEGIKTIRGVGFILTCEGSA
jgi:two-component system OmpR family response regulator